MTVIENLVSGPFRDEQEFKRAAMRAWERNSGGHYTCFEIENQEKEPGMPDVLAMSRVYPAYFAEFKYARDSVIEFTKAQPLFYKSHPDLLIWILVWDAGLNRVIQVKPAEAVKARTLRMKIPLLIDAADGGWEAGGQRRGGEGRHEYGEEYPDSRGRA